MKKELREALSELVDPSCLDEWFATPNDSFKGRTPNDMIDQGAADEIWEMIYFLRSGNPT